MGNHCICTQEQNLFQADGCNADLSRPSLRSADVKKIHKRSLNGNQQLLATVKSEKILELHNNNTNKFSGAAFTFNETTDSKGKVTLFSSIGPENCILQTNPFAMIPQTDEVKLRDTLNNHFLFVEMSDDIIKYLYTQIQVYHIDKNYVIYSEGQDSNQIYILVKGELEVKSKGKVITYYKEPVIFGEIALISQTKREETITALTDCSIYILEGILFKEILHKIADEKYKDRFNFLNTIVFFKTMDCISKYNVCEKIKVEQFSPGTQIISFGEEGNSLFLIKEGLVSCEINGKQIRQLKNNEYFGQNAVLIDGKRGMDIIALKRTVCYKLMTEDLKLLFGINYRDTILFTFFKSVVENHPYFNDLIIDSMYMNFYQMFVLQTYKNNEPIFANGNFNKRIIIVLEGSIYDMNKSTIVNERSSIFGVQFLENKNTEIIGNSLVAQPDLIALEAPIDKVLTFLGIKKELKQINILSRMRKLRRSFLFKNISKKSLEAIAKSLQKIKFSQGDIILKENTQGENIYLIIKGKVRVTKEGKTLRDLEAGNYFGEMALIYKKEDMRTATVTAIDKVVVYSITKSDFDLIISDQATREHLMNKIALQDTEISIENLFFIKFLGMGKFGNVFLVHNNKTVYSIKVISRISGNQQRNIGQSFLNERKVMITIDHPFIIKMIKTMKNDLYCFFLIEYVNGINLAEYLRHRTIIKDVNETKFYSASLLLMVDYLQKKYIAHRDIKPNNIMIDSNGYLKMIDFGTSKFLKDYTSTLLGTPSYIAPEIIMGKGYARSCDFWSVGVCIYEIFYGEVPFGKEATSVAEVYKQIIQKDLSFPSENNKTLLVNQFMSTLLKKKVSQRLCNFNLLKSTQFFKDFDWDKLIDFQYSPPFFPKTFNLHNFQYIYTQPFLIALEDSPIAESSQSFTAFDSPRNDIRWAEEF